MSAKRAKQLRKLTKMIVTQQLAQGQQVSDETMYVEKQKNRKYGTIADKLGGEEQRVVIAAGTIMTTTASVRGIYKAIKKKLAKDGSLEMKPYDGYKPKVDVQPGPPSQRAPFIHTSPISHDEPEASPSSIIYSNELQLS